MNQYLFVISLVLSIFSSGGYVLCSAHEKSEEERTLALVRGTEKPVPESVLALFRRSNCPIRVRDQDTGTLIKSMLSKSDSTPRLRAEQLKPLLQRVDNELYAPAYNATDCALKLCIVRAAAGLCAYELSKGCMRLIHIPDDLQGMKIESVEEAHTRYRRRQHRSSYGADVILPLNDALMFILNEGKIALSIGEKILVPKTIEDTVHESDAE